MNYKRVLLTLVYQETDQNHGTRSFNPHRVWAAPAALMAIAPPSVPTAVGSGAAAGCTSAACGNG